MIQIRLYTFQLEGRSRFIKAEFVLSKRSDQKYTYGWSFNGKRPTALVAKQKLEDCVYSALRYLESTQERLGIETSQIQKEMIDQLLWNRNN